MKKSFIYSAAVLSALGMGNMAQAARGAERGADDCAPAPPVTCYPDDCQKCYCLGPENYGVNAPVCPLTCAGDFSISVSGFYWNAHQDGMAFAVRNSVVFPVITVVDPGGAVDPTILATNNLIDADYQNPNSRWDFGFKIGLDYCTTCDGWDVGIEWTWFRGKANNHVETEASDNQVLLPLISAFASVYGGPNFVSDIDAQWRVDLNLVDIELGRHFWTSKYLSIRPFIGLRVAYIDQNYYLTQRGGSFGPLDAAITAATQVTVNNYVDIDNDFHGVGPRSGLDSTWNFGCGWALFGTFAGSIVYGRFDVDYDETNREAVSPHTKSKISEWSDNFRSSRAMLDLALGVQWMGMFCECQYGLRVALGWENHMFFDQNQMWRVNRIGDGPVAALPNNTGENVYVQSRGDLDTQGWTLTVDFTF